jgi:uncharacterized membrane protein
MEMPELYDPPQRSAVNVSMDERTVSLIGGVGLITFALWRRGTLTLPALLTGASLIYQSVTGKNPLNDVLNRDTAVKTNSARVSVPHKQGIHVTRAVTIDRPVQDLYNFWHDPANLPQVMTYVESVQPIGENRTHWTLKLPNDATVEFDSEVYTDTPNEVISWRSLPGSQFQNAGSVRFRPAPAGRGTEVHLTVEFVPPGGRLGRAALKLFGDVPNQYIAQYLRDFKQMMETGEKATTEGQTSGRKGEVRQ